MNGEGTVANAEEATHPVLLDRGVDLYTLADETMAPTRVGNGTTKESEGVSEANGGATDGVNYRNNDYDFIGANPNDSSAIVRSSERRDSGLQASPESGEGGGAPAGETAEKAEPEAPAPTLTVAATAYVATCEGCTGITFSGVDVRNTIYHEGERVIAVDPAVIPIGSRVKLTFQDGTSFVARAEDVGSAINGYEIDLLVGSEGAALAFGRQGVEVTILD